MPVTDPPFMPEKDKPAFHLRPWTPEELAQCHRMRAAYEQCFKQPTGGQDNGTDPQK